MSRLDFDRRVRALGQFKVANPAAPVLAETDAHHLGRVLRAKPGEEIVVTNGAGHWAFARIADSGLERVSEVLVDDEDPDVALYLSPLKGDRSEYAIAKATELGVSRIVPLLAARVVVTTRGGALDKMIAKWRRVAQATSGQCRRTYDLVVDQPLSVDEVPESVVVADFGGAGDLGGVSAIAVGPEGGWSLDEWSPQRRRIGLGLTVLRGDTAAVAAATLLVQSRDGWSRHARERGVGNDEGTR